MEDWKRGLFNVKSIKKFNLRKKVETTSFTIKQIKMLDSEAF